MSDLEALNNRIQELENALAEMSIQVKNSRKTLNPVKVQSVAMFGLTRALCVDTFDPWGEHRVKFYHPLFHNPNTPISALPYAKPNSAAGGFDDCGMMWVPPAGSTLTIFFENGNRDAAYYFGTTWQRSRGISGYDMGYPVKEYQDVYNGHRKGYLVGANDESQCLPSWTSENYNNGDRDSILQFYNDPQEQLRATYPHIYGLKTPEKHWFKLDDGDAKCNRRNKRMELGSGGGGGFMVFKDDPFHRADQVANPSCTGMSPDVSQCANHQSGQTIGPDGSVITSFLTDPQGTPIEGTGSCSDSGKILGGKPNYPGSNTQTGGNKYYRHQNECRPYKGPGTPQNNKVDLPQVGIQILSYYGGTMGFDDSVEQPEIAPTWERSIANFNRFGCTDKFMGRFFIKSVTGHSFTMSEQETEKGVRSDKNFVEMRSANGGFVQINDHTAGQSGESCPPNYGGQRRGVWIGSTSKHGIDLCDYMVQQCSPTRKEGGVPVANATQAFARFYSGAGSELRFQDDNSQEFTQSQWIQLTQPQCIGAETDPYCNSERGPHFLRMQAKPQGQPGIVMLRAGGHAVRSTYDMDIVLVGDKEKNPSDKFTYVSKMFITASEDVHFRYSGESHIFMAEKQIVLMAGRDCPPAPLKKCKGPCIYPVIIARCPVICPLTGILHWTEKAVSERVLASGNHPCQIGCGGSCGEYFAEMAAGQDQPCTEDDTNSTNNTTNTQNNTGLIG